MRNSNRNMRGIGLLELMLSLAIISVLLVMATRYYKAAHQSEQVNTTLSLIQAIVAASANWVVGQSDYTGIDIKTLIDNGYLPKGSNIDSWGGDVSVTKNGNNDREINITLANLPRGACNSLYSKICQQTVNGCNGAANYCNSQRDNRLVLTF